VQVDDADRDIVTHDLVPPKGDEKLALHHTALLDLENFKATSGAGGWDAAVTSLILPPILRMLQLRLTIASKVDLGDGRGPRPVAENIPPCRIHTVELEIDPREETLMRTRP
jgi:hypothetical protein